MGMHNPYLLGIALEGEVINEIALDMSVWSKRLNIVQIYFRTALTLKQKAVHRNIVVSSCDRQNNTYSWHNYTKTFCNCAFLSCNSLLNFKMA